MTTLNTNFLNQVFEAAKDYNGAEIIVALLKNEENQQIIVSHLNNNLQIASTRNVAFNFINELFVHFSYDILKANANLWLGKCIDLKVAFKKEHYVLICNLLKCLDEEQEFRKYVVSNCIAKIIEQCLVVNSYIDNLLCLELCMQKYSSTCLPHKLKIEAFLLNVLTSSDNYNASIVKQCGRCFHFLQQVGGAGIDGITHKSNWSITFKKLCATMHNLYDVLFDSIAELNDYEKINIDPYQLPDVPSSATSIEVLNIATNRIKNITCCLQAFLEAKYPVVKNVAPQMVLDVIKRGLNVHNCLASKSQYVHEFVLKDNIINIQVSLLMLFRSFLACLHKNAVPYSTQITKILLDLLMQMKKCHCYDPYSKYITYAYKVFIYWVVLMKSKIDASCHNRLIAFLSEQIKPEKNCLQLTIQSSIKRKQSNKKSKQTVATANSNTPKKIVQFNSTTPEIKCLNALRLLDHLFVYVPLRITPEKFAGLFSIIITTLMKVESGNKEYPYTNAKCEEQLYNVLLSFFEQPFTTYSPPFELCSGIFLNGQKSKNSTIALTCYRGINVIEKLAQPIYPTLYFATLLNNAINYKDRNEYDLYDGEEKHDRTEGIIETNGTNDNDIFTSKVVDETTLIKNNVKRNSNSMDISNGNNKKLKTTDNEKKKIKNSTIDNLINKQNTKKGETCSKSIVQATEDPASSVEVSSVEGTSTLNVALQKKDTFSEESITNGETITARFDEEGDLMDSFNDVLADS